MYSVGLRDVPSGSYKKREWFSGKIPSCHLGAPGSTPGSRIFFCSPSTHWAVELDVAASTTGSSLGVTINILLTATHLYCGPIQFRTQCEHLKPKVMKYHHSS
ncbi:uncharacterized protein CYBJADRAFT_8336 [Cyberlindnera jadinii NRRL Y-1542]|uniref:Uncharacterized protein n=1 Tax=Cyberlindnera jadinii (strain ATCC 18201 / CBS 1600 / BCRC 20928 / JCM 3617 / NBRC 0987 / NRRL Y-1542) TaxID=983966 RepID=A0A1E4S9N9_CYBJN|nr:hypothetical protein CYBJADRAFT_8336 [Cyberlindnera jadinii NRRL Y-1542]ODV76204.1 hypothetical protein CYBJADRAFT_8336 [Cyberlindnera jadinii NRRL Y-1542]